MITFFRRVRQQLLSESKFSKYLVYAIGEIVLVVIGILIALQINNWNQNQLNKQKESQYYERLLEDVREEKAILEAVINYSYQVVHHAKKAVLVFENSPTASSNPIENLVDMYQASQLQDPNPASSTYKELIASGQINLLQNDKLKSTLMRYYETDWMETGVFKLINRYRENLRGKMPDAIQTAIRSSCGDIYTKTRDSYLTSLPTSCDPTIEATFAASVVSELRTDESLKEDLRYLIGNEMGKQVDVSTAIRQLEEVITLLEKITHGKDLPKH